MRYIAMLTCLAACLVWGDFGSKYEVAAEDPPPCQQGSLVFVNKTCAPSASPGGQCPGGSTLRACCGPSTSSLVTCDKWASASDCSAGADCSSYAWGPTEWTYKLVGTQGCLYKVETRYTATGASTITINTKGVLTCDNSSAWNKCQVKNDQCDADWLTDPHQADVPDELPLVPGPYATYTESLSKDSGTYVSGCTHSPDDLFSGTERAYSGVYVRSRGYAQADLTHSALGIWYRVSCGQRP